MFGPDILHEWLVGGSVGSSTYALTANTPRGLGVLDFSDGQMLTNAVIMLGISNGQNSVTFGLQEGSSSTGASFTDITDGNASVTLSGVGSATLGIINGQRTYQYVKVVANSNQSDTVGIAAIVLDIRTQMPLGSSGASRSPAGPATVT